MHSHTVIVLLLARRGAGAGYLRAWEGAAGAGVWGCVELEGVARIVRGEVVAGKDGEVDAADGEEGEKE